MAESINISRLRGPSTLLHYGLAVLAVSAATIIQQFGDKHFAVTPSYFCAVLLTAWLVELGPALFAIALSNLALMYYFVPPTRTFVIDATYIPSLILFSMAALFVTWLSGRERSTTRSLVYARNQLDLKIHEINKTNEALQAEITERKRAEDRQRRTEAWLCQSESLSRSGTRVYNATTNLYIYWSDESYRIWGFDPQQGLPSRDDMLRRIHPDDRDRVREKVQEAVRQKTDLAIEFRILLPDGTVKYLEVTSRHLFSSEGAFLEAVTCTVDVTQRKRTEQALRASEAKFRAAIDGIAGLVAIMAPFRIQ